jgi:hypothetical protein
VSLPNLKDEEHELIVRAILESVSEMPLNEIELHIEHWISNNIDDEWNVYIELAENGDLSIETISHMQRIQKRLAVLGQKTFRRIHQTPDVSGAAATEQSSSSSTPATPAEKPKERRKIFLQKHTRKIKRLSSTE